MTHISDDILQVLKKNLEESLTIINNLSTSTVTTTIPESHPAFFPESVVEKSPTKVKAKTKRTIIKWTDVEINALKELKQGATPTPLTKELCDSKFNGRSISAVNTKYRTIIRKDYKKNPDMIEIARMYNIPVERVKSMVTLKKRESKK